ncbi:hypothetical protein CC78DRAFT_76163 [Lojkania enalia]|uniref:Uncharacterized protein n=1 Tax=Lojkania enalia TaxID=147567 RepID=A0A9P4KDU1_9PLEO|nr:hypothetical protein CC78DRAFT_76163 [Didymosphaeria enalia]
MMGECWNAIVENGKIFWKIRLLTVPRFVFLVVGGIHLIAWNFSFPTDFEANAWRVCSLVLTTSVPLTWVIGHGLAWIGKRNANNIREEIEDRLDAKSSKRLSYVGMLIIGVQVLGFGLYAIARLYLLFEVFLALRSVPEVIYDTPEWTNFLPHFS